MYKNFNDGENVLIRKKYKKVGIKEIFSVGKSIKNSDDGENFSMLKEMHKKFDVWKNISIRKTFAMGENFFNGKKVV